MLQFLLYILKFFTYIFSASIIVAFIVWMYVDAQLDTVLDHERVGGRKRMTWDDYFALFLLVLVIGLIAFYIYSLVYDPEFENWIPEEVRARIVQYIEIPNFILTLIFIFSLLIYGNFEFVLGYKEPYIASLIDYDYDIERRKKEEEEKKKNKK